MFINANMKNHYNTIQWYIINNYTCLIQNLHILGSHTIAYIFFSAEILEMIQQ